MKRAIWIVRIIVSVLTSYVPLKIIYPNMEIWEHQKIVNSTITEVLSSDFLVQSIIASLIIIGLFYWLLPLVLNILVSGWLQVVVNKIIMKANKTNTNIINLAIFCTTNTLTKFIYKIELRKANKFEKYNELNYSDICYDVFGAISLFIQILLCWIFIPQLNQFNIGWIIIFIISYLILTLLILPLVKNKINYMEMIITSINNRIYFKKVSQKG